MSFPQFSTTFPTLLSNYTSYENRKPPLNGKYEAVRDKSVIRDRSF